MGQVITASQFMQQATHELEIPGFEDGTTITVRVRKLSLVGLISTGKIPNALMKKVQSLFEGIKSEMKDMSPEATVQVMENADDIGKILDIVCNEAMIEPLYADIADYMNDTQKLEIFAFTQRGVKALENFPANTGSDGLAIDGEDLQNETESAN